MERNSERIVKQVNLAYYLIYTATILSTIIGYIITMNSQSSVNIQSSLSITLSSVIILYIMISIPTALALFHRNLKKWREIEDQFLKYKKYIAGAKLRLFIVGLGLVASVIAHFILYAGTPNMSMIACAGISAVALIFCKPNAAKIASELDLDEE